MLQPPAILSLMEDNIVWKTLNEKKLRRASSYELSGVTFWCNHRRLLSVLAFDILILISWRASIKISISLCMLLPGLRSLLGLSLLFSLLEALQLPLGPPHAFSLENENYDAWDIHVAPNENATGHLVFETVHSLMQHWPNTRYRHGVLIAVLFLNDLSTLCI